MQDYFFFSASSHASDNVFIFPNGLSCQRGRYMAKKLHRRKDFHSFTPLQVICVEQGFKSIFIFMYISIVSTNKISQYCAQTNVRLGMAQFLLWFLPVQHWLQCAYFRFSLKELKLEADFSLSSTQHYVVQQNLLSFY